MEIIQIVYEDMFKIIEENTPLVMTEDDETKVLRFDALMYGIGLAYGKKPLGQFIHEIVNLDMNAAKEEFSEYLGEANLNSR